MNDLETLLITDDVIEASQITRWLDIWGHNVTTTRFSNNQFFSDDLLNNDLILIDITTEDEMSRIEILEIIKQNIKVPVIYFTNADEKLLNLHESLPCIKKPVNAKELELTIEMELYKSKMECALHQSEKKYKLLVENADDPIAIISKDGEFVLVNPSAARYFGGDPEDLKGKNMWDIFPKQYADSQMRSIENVIETGKGIVTNEKTIINNREKWFSSKIQPIKDPDGTISNIQLIARDITLQKKIEKDLIDRENFFSGTLNDMQTFVAVLKPTGEIIFVNNTPLKIIEKKLSDVEGLLFYETSWWDYSEEVKASIKRDIELCARGKTIGHEIQVNTLNGMIWIDYSMHPVYDSNGKVKYLVPEGRDISNIKKAKKALSSEKNRFMSLTQNAPFGMVLIDKNGVYKYINPKFVDIVWL